MNIEVADKLFENIAYYSIKASMELAKEKVHTLHSKVLNGKLVHTSHVVGYTSDRWKQLAADVAKYGSAMVT